jgi:exodeoxyribonuclease VII large subunit
MQISLKNEDVAISEVYLSVTKVINVISNVLEERVGELLFEGEMGQLTLAGSGHLYFSVKDTESPKPAVITCVMWRGSVSKLSFRPVQGKKVRCVGTCSLYAPTGKLQLVVTKMEEVGEGTLQEKFLQLKNKLENEGLFNSSRKRPLPYFPKCIGIVTSATGAVIHDIMHVLDKRKPGVEVLLFDSRVQGEGSALEIAKGIEVLNKIEKVEVIIVARGGGSLEDLWSFNEEIVVRTLFASIKPTISAVGHEVDVSLSDLVADVRAPTPTAAAELVLPDKGELFQRLVEYQRRINDISRWFSPIEQRLDEIAGSLTQSYQKFFRELLRNSEILTLRINRIEPRTILKNFEGTLRQLNQRLISPMNTKVNSLKYALLQNSQRLNSLKSRFKIDDKKGQVNKINLRLLRSRDKYLTNCNERLLGLSGRLEVASPIAVIKRGFAIIEDNNGVIITTTNSVAIGSKLKILVADGTIISSVDSIEVKS